MKKSKEGATNIENTNTIQTKEKPAAQVEITCVDCGTTRIINRGEAFQVRRCVICQEKHRKELRKLYRKQRLVNLKDRIAQLESILIRHNLATEIPS